MPNLGVLGGDAAQALAHHTRPRSFDAIYVNFPEPPSDHTDAEDYLLNEAFFARAHEALVPGGRGLIIVSDNPILLNTAARTLEQHTLQGRGLDFRVRTGTRAGWPRVVGVAGLDAAGAALVSEGLPEGFGANGSWFDRLWSGRGHVRRFYIHLEVPLA